MKRLGKVVIAVIAAVGVYLVGGIVLGSWIFPPQAVDYPSYFQPGDKFVSRWEGFDQTVLAVDGDWLHTRLEIQPQAAGPPEHFHERFTETFTVKSGTLSILVNGEKRILKPGETLSVPPLTPHKPFNETGEVVIVEGADTKSVPVKFGYHLSQIYGLIDQTEDGPSASKIMLQFSVYGDEMDTWIAGPPLSIQKALRIIIAPTARLLGYKNYYPEFQPRH